MLVNDSTARASAFGGEEGVSTLLRAKRAHEPRLSHGVAIFCPSTVSRLHVFVYCVKALAGIWRGVDAESLMTFEEHHRAQFVVDGLSNCSGRRAVGGMYNMMHVVCKANVLFDNALYVDIENKGKGSTRTLEA